MSLKNNLTFSILLLTFACAHTPIQKKADTGADPRWTTIDSLNGIGQYATALELTMQVRESAQEQGDPHDEFKAWMYIGRFRQFTGQELKGTIADMQQRAEKAPEPLRSLLFSVIAESYWNYYQQERWQVLERTNTAVDPDDIDTWGQRVFMEHVIDHFERSLAARDTLSDIPAGRLGVLLTGGPDVALRPTVYDLLAHRALAVFMNSETRIAEPAWRYAPSRKTDFALFEDFALQPPIPHSVPAERKDSTAWAYQAMRVFKDLTRLHLADDSPAALVDLDLIRLEFVRQHSTLANKDSLYLEAVTTLRSRVPNDSSWSEVTHALAQWHAEQGRKYDRFTDGPFKHEKDTALALCEAAIGRFPGSFGATRCAALKAQLIQPAMGAQVEEAVEPETPFKVLVSHTNVERMWWRLVPYPLGPEQEIALDRDAVLKLLKMKPNQQGEVVLPDHADLNEHAVEVPLAAPVFGNYVLLFSSGSAFDQDDDLISHSQLTVSRIGLTERSMSGNGVELLVFDRITGKALKNVTVDHWFLERKGNMMRYVQRAQQKTDEEGRATFPFKGERGNGRWEVTHGEDRLVTGSRYFWDRGERQEIERTRTFLFTDRAIYRPGQEVHFKGIVVRGKGKENTVVVDRQSTVVLHDVNGEKVEEISVTTDAYGAFHGTFHAPSGGLTGVMTLRETNGTATVRVEEYKRPTFETVFRPVNAVAVVGETVAVNGSATSYAGVPLDGSAVQWRVVREARMPWWGGWNWNRGFPWGRSTEIASGTTATDAQGRFTVSFLARGDEAIPAAASPLFHFRVEASVTDVNGETRTGTTSLVVGHKRFQIHLDLPDAVDRSELDSLRVQARNMNDVPLDIPVQVRIHYITSPLGKPFRPRLWERPDGFVLDKPEHDRLFSEMAYSDQADPLTWPVERTVFEGVVSNGAVALKGAGQWRVGDHRIELTSVDSLGDTVRVEKHFSLYDPDIQWTGAPSEAFLVQELNTTVQPGEKAQLLISTGLPEASVLMEVERQGAISVRRRFTLKNGQQLIELPAQEEDRGGFVVHFLCAERGILHRSTHTIKVPWSNKELQVEWMTFRDKLLPGTDEEWRLRITGPKGNKIVAQLLAVMYDASLDQFVPHTWSSPSIWPDYAARWAWEQASPFGVKQAQRLWRRVEMPRYVSRSYPALELFGFGGYGGMAMDMYETQSMSAGAPMRGARSDALANAEEVTDDSANKNATEDTMIEAQEPTPPVEAPPVVRTDFRETAFFFPDLLTDRDGAVVLRFKSPDALTRWNVMGLAHTPELQFAQFTRSTITQRPLMVVPNLPRFLREGDRITLTAKINALEQRIEGSATIDLFDPATNASLNERFGLRVKQQVFVAAPGESAVVGWSMRVPAGVDMVAVRITAKGGGGPVGGATFADGEERVLPVLTDRILVTESLPLPVNGAGTKQFSLDKLVNSKASSTLRNQSLKLEFTPNPAWYAVQALPYLMEFPHACSEQIFSRYYANRLATHITEQKPRIKEVFQAWKDAGPDAFLSALEKNTELKDIVLAETPWVVQARSERERKERIAVLFDLERMSAEEAKSLRKLMEMQRSDGAWSWFGGMHPSRYITQHIVAGFGHLETLGAADLRPNGPVQVMLKKAVDWLDMEMLRQYEELRKRNSAADMKKYRPGMIELHYLYTRSFFQRWPMSSSVNTAATFYRERLAAEWLSYGLQEQAMIAMALHRYGDTTVPTLILTSLRQRATVHEELGMYWKNFSGGVDWWSFPTETHALMIEAYSEVTKDAETVKQLRIHLLKLKQTTDWKTTKATAEAVYALLLGGEDWLEPAPAPVITVGKETLAPESIEAGTGYFSKSWSADVIVPEMGKVTVTTTSDRVAWGALHWQYFEQMDQVTPHESPFSLKKQVLWKQATDAGPVLVALDRARPLHPGDELIIRIELRTDRWLDFVHLKDLRGAGLEPVEALSGHRYQGGLGYYQSIRDAAMHFFFDRISPGTYVFEYPLRVTHTGDFSNGITTAMCMYAPEFSTHSEGVRVEVGE